METHWIGSPERPLTVAIVGTGPSGFYALQALSRVTTHQVRADLFDRLPTPFGLVRAGIAPDHPSVKGVAKVYDRLARLPWVRFFGGVRVGTDLTVETLLAHYDAVIWAVGCEKERALGIPGEELPGVYSATEFVFWYNGHPDYSRHQFALAGAHRAVVVGNGNVAIDVARVLAKSAADLAPTDIAHHALETLTHSTIREVSVLGRRGPAEAAFTAPELKELGGLDNACLRIEGDLPTPAGDKRLELLHTIAAHPPRDCPRGVRMRFCISPVAILGTGRVEAIRLQRNRLETRGDRVVAVPEGEPWEEPTDLVFKAVGYRGVPLPGVPFDEERGHIPHIAGRVVDSTKRPLRGHYVVGWAKRGPSGVVGTNKPDAEETVLVLLADMEGRRGAPLADVGPELDARGIRPVDWAGWERIDLEERLRGEAAGKPREKLVHHGELHRVAKPE